MTAPQTKTSTKTTRQPEQEGFRQAMAWLHTWAGLIFGWLLFAIFLTGTLAYFKDEISHWMQPEVQARPMDGGAGALLAKCIKKAELIAYEDLGAEALRKLYVEDMPLVVIIDSEGNNLYEEGRAEYLAEHKAHEAEKNA